MMRMVSAPKAQGKTVRKGAGQSVLWDVILTCVMSLLSSIAMHSVTEFKLDKNASTFAVICVFRSDSFH